ncbi:MAG: tetratricopeptide repeat protein [Gemmatimonadota bacterium]|nr:tetratricopeptide repeat protein [Gemmatimonadota bacterium]MDH4349496.1 tetratricopeptide repeat protein [Gemmatimonadota bacterium]
MNKQETEAPERSADQDRLEQLVKWVRANERVVTIVAVVLAVTGAGVWFAVSARQRRETFARRELTQARQAAEAGNLPLAASDLARVVGSFGGTSAGQEAKLVLAEVRLRQGQAALAATELREFVESGVKPQYRSQAYELLGVALEQSGQAAAAGRAFEDGANAAQGEYRYLSASLLLSASRSYSAAGDTTAAIRVLERIETDFDETSAAQEARLRLAELGRYEN